MDKFDYGSFNPDKEASVFTTDKGYSESSGEAETRKQFSYPLDEVKEYINKVTPVNNAEESIQLRINAQELLQYRDSETGDWQDTASGGHIIGTTNDEGEIIDLPQRTRLVFKDTDVSDTGAETIIRCKNRGLFVGVKTSIIKFIHSTSYLMFLTI